MNKKSSKKSKLLLQNILTSNMSDPEKAGQIITLEKEFLNGRAGIASLGTTTIYEIDGSNRITKKSRATKEPTPDIYHKIYKLVFRPVLINIDYEKRMNNLLIQAGQNPDFKSGEHYAKRFNDSLIVFQNKKDESKLYVRIYLFEEQKTYHCAYFDKNMNRISEDKIQDLKDNYLPTRKKSIIPLCQYHMSNIKFLKYGEFRIEDVEIDDFKKLIMEY
jgi:hypothetical protein